jgi:hypothetical protein
MNKTLIIFSLIASFTVLNASYATSIENGRFISHKEWNTGYFTSSFLDISDQKQIFLVRQLSKSLRTNSHPENVNVTDKLSNTQLTGTTSTPTTINGTSNMTISNMSSALQTYTITTKICVVSNSFPIQCANANDIVQLDKQGVATLSRLPSLVITLPTTGNYDTIIGTDISKDATILYSFYTTGMLTIT